VLNAIIRAALRYRLFVVFLSLAVLVTGGWLATTLPIDVFPDLDRPRVELMTECPGLAPADVETLVSAPLESAMLGANGVENVRSASGMGLSVVTVEFGWSTDVRTARQVVQERLTSVSATLPRDVKPQLEPISSILGQILLVGVYRLPAPNGGVLAPVGDTRLLAELDRDSVTGEATVVVRNPHDDTGARIPHPPQWRRVTPDRVVVPEPADAEGDTRATVVLEGKSHAVVFRSPAHRELDLRTLADWVVAPRIRKVPGVARVVAMGGGRKQYQVLADPTALARHDVTLEEVSQALGRNNRNTSGGYAERSGQEVPVRYLGRLGPEPDRVLEQLRAVPVKPNAERPVLLKQVARVAEGAQLKRGDSSINGQPGVLLTVSKQPHVDTRELTDEIVAGLREVEASLPADVVIDSELFRMKRFIDQAVSNVGEALATGALLVLVVLFLFLLNFRTTFISLTAIPLSLAVTVLVFRATEWLTGVPVSINVMTLGGIAVAMGELVDDAIVDVENIFRRLTLNHASPQPRPVLLVIYEASVEVRSAIVFGTATVILVFLPLFALSGMEGRLFTPLAVAYVTSILASLLVSLTVTPVLSYYLLAGSRATHRTRDSLLLRGLKWCAAHLVRFSMEHVGWLLAGSWALVAVSVLLLVRLDHRFLPEFDEGTMQVNVVLPPDASLQSSNEVGAVVDAKLQSLQASPENPRGEILQFARRSGRAELDPHVDPVNNNEFVVSVNPAAGRSRDDVLKRLREELQDEVPTAEVELEQPLQHLISHALTGVSAHVAIRVYGDDLDVLRGTAEQVRTVSSGVPGIASLVLESQQTVSEIHVVPRDEELAFHGVDRDYVGSFVETALGGETVSQVIEGQRRFDLVLRLDEPYRSDFHSLERLRLSLPGRKETVTLGTLARVTEGTGPNEINRDNGRRRLVIRCNTSGRDPGRVAADVRERVRQSVRLPEGYSVEYGGQFVNQQRTTGLLVVLSLVSLVGMFMVLYLLFPSVRIVLQILNALPAAFVGGVAALVLTGQPLTVAALVGFISLGGIAARNGILLVAHYFHLMKHEGEAFTPEMVLRGSLERLAPVLMTALTAGIALVPLVLGGQQPGREILYPVATVILGGLVTSTLCEFLLHPGLFRRFSGPDAERLTRTTE
jgi:CzcA family heavy metal efflux pump